MIEIRELNVESELDFVRKRVEKEVLTNSKL